MNTIRTSVFLLALSLSGGCASITPVEPRDEVCTTAAPGNKINIVYQRHNKITVAPPQLTVDEGEEIWFFVKGSESRPFKTKGTKPPPEHPSAKVDWLNSFGEGGTVGNGSSFKVCVPDTQESGDYEYLIEIEDVGTLDPVVRVQ